jgi:hypothetical protein
MPITKPFTRRSGFRDATLIIIATEGERTEQVYFNDLKVYFHRPSIHIEVLQKRVAGSSPRGSAKKSLRFFP